MKLCKCNLHILVQSERYGDELAPFDGDGVEDGVGRDGGPAQVRAQMAVAQNGAITEFQLSKNIAFDGSFLN